MTTTIPTGVFLVQAAVILAAHPADHTLPEPASLRVSTGDGHSQVRAQLRSSTTLTVARDLLAWADSLTTVTVETWRIPAGDRMHLSIANTLAGPTSTVELDVFGAVAYDPALLAELKAGDHWEMSVGQLRTWAASSATLDDHRSH